MFSWENKRRHIFTGGNQEKDFYLIGKAIYIYICIFVEPFIKSYY